MTASEDAACGEGLSEREDKTPTLVSRTLSVPAHALSLPSFVRQPQLDVRRDSKGRGDSGEGEVVVGPAISRLRRGSRRRSSRGSGLEPGKLQGGLN
eukprot:927234-Pyramimonas_sp.AAC.1